MGTMNFNGVNQAAMTPINNANQPIYNHNAGQNNAAQVPNTPSMNINQLVAAIQALLGQLVQNNLVYTNANTALANNNTLGGNNQAFGGSNFVTPPLPNLTGTNTPSIFGGQNNNGFAANGGMGGAGQAGTNGLAGGAGNGGSIFGNNTGATGGSIFNVSVPSLGTGNTQTATQNTNAATIPTLGTGTTPTTNNIANPNAPTLGPARTPVQNQTAGRGTMLNSTLPSLGNTNQAQVGNTGLPTSTNGTLLNSSIPSLGNGQLSTTSAVAPQPSASLLSGGAIPTLGGGQVATANNNTVTLQRDNNGNLLSTDGIPSLGGSIRQLSGELGLPNNGNGNRGTGSHWTN